MRPIFLIVSFGLLLSPTLSGAGGEILQCADRQGEPAIYRKGECQPLDDPTVPPGQVSRSGHPLGGLEELKNKMEEANDRHFLEVEELKRKLEEVKEKKGEDDALKGELAELRKKLAEAMEQHFEEVETIRKELVAAKERDKEKKRVENAPKEGGLGVNASRPEEMTPLGSPGPWSVSQILVPARGAADRGDESFAMINGYRYRLGERVDGGGVVKGIASDRVIMLHGNREYVVPFNKKTHALVAGQLGVVPLTKEKSGTYRLKLRINNNQEIDAVLDTGSSTVLLPEDVVTWLRRSGTLKPQDFMGKVKAVIADGSIVDGRRFMIRYLRVGDMELRDVEGVELASEKKEEKKSNDDKGSKDNQDPGKDESKPDILEVKQPLFGINALTKLGRWRIDHQNDQLIVDR
ncbi:MAG: aspartyl protease family protein [Magnetococcales bacterium]|nr:aspartyl protease family protein [Magnetococcales bacterium]